MSETFEGVVTNAGSGGSTIAADIFTQTAVEYTLPASYLVYGAKGGPYTRVDVATGLPILGQRAIGDTDDSYPAYVMPIGVWDAGVERMTFLQGTSNAQGGPASLLVSGDKAEDSAHASGDLGMPIWAVRRDANTTMVGTDGDYAPLQVDANGALKVTGGGGGTQYAEDAAHVSGDTGTMALGVRKDTAAQVAGTDGDYCPSIYDSSGRLHVNVGTGTVAISGTASVNVTNAPDINEVAVIDRVIPGTTASDLGKAEDAAHTSGDVGVFVLAVQKATPADLGADGDYAPIQVSAGRVWTNASNNGTFVIQENGAALTSLQLIDDVVFAEDAAHTTGDKGIMALAVQKATPADLGADGDYGPIQVSAGRVWTNASNNGTFVTQENGAALTALQLIDDPVIADDAAFTPATSKVMMAGFEADETATDSVDEGDAGAARMTLDRKQIVTVQPHTAGGLTMSKTVSAGSTNATNVKNAAGNLYHIYVSNVNAAVRYLKLYNTSSAPSVGTDVPVWTLAIPGNTAGAGFTLNIPQGLTFSTGISFALTTEATDAGSTGVSANEHVVNLGYK